jgi:hypothetical protein
MEIKIIFKFMLPLDCEMLLEYIFKLDTFSFENMSVFWQN